MVNGVHVITVAQHLTAVQGHVKGIPALTMDATLTILIPAEVPAGLRVRIRTIRTGTANPTGPLRAALVDIHIIAKEQAVAGQSRNIVTMQCTVADHGVFVQIQQMFQPVMLDSCIVAHLAIPIIVTRLELVGIQNIFQTPAAAVVHQDKQNAMVIAIPAHQELYVVQAVGLLPGVAAVTKSVKAMEPV